MKNGENSFYNMTDQKIRGEKMTDKIRTLQEQLGKIIKGKKEVTDKIIMAILARRTCASGGCSRE